VSIQAEIVLSAAAPSASTPSLARAIVWFTLVHTVPLVLLIAVDVLPGKFIMASAHADQPSLCRGALGQNQHFVLSGIQQTTSNSGNIEVRSRVCPNR
jgi:hypothetical protein